MWSVVCVCVFGESELRQMAYTPVQGEEQASRPTSAGREFLMDLLDELSSVLGATIAFLAISQSCSLPLREWLTPMVESDFVSFPLVSGGGAVVLSPFRGHRRYCCLLDQHFQVL